MKIQWPWVSRATMEAECDSIRGFHMKWNGERAERDEKLIADLRESVTNERVAKHRAMREAAALELRVASLEAESRRLKTDVLESQMLILDRVSKTLVQECR